MNAKEMPSGKWKAEGVYREDGKRIRKSFTADTKKAAELAAREFSDRRKKLTGQTVGEAIDAMIEGKRPVLSPSTVRSYVTMRNAIEKNYHALWSAKVDNLSENAVQKVVNDLSKTHTPKTVRNYVAMIGASLPPTLRIRNSVTLPARIRPEYHIPTSDTVQAILEASADTELRIPILLAVVCTMRAGEICALEMSDISDTSIHIHRNMVKGPDGWVIKSPKTYSSDRYVTAPDWLIVEIKKKGYVTHYTPNGMTLAFRKLLARNGVSHFRFHDLRHYSASYMHAQGVPTAYIMKRGGWNTETVLNAVYRHALDDRDRIETEKINKEFTDLFF